MQLFSLLDASFPLLEEGFTVEGGWLSWLASFIRILIEGIGITGVGVIVFTLIMKAVILPFDIYQRVKMRKQNLIMRNMQEDLQKLQKQYANDKNMYSAKMMELYKKNGYSMFGACLPMILSMFILIVAFQALNEYSQVANLSMYERMTSAYNAAVLTYSVDIDDPTAIKSTEDRREGTFVIIKGIEEDQFIYLEYNENETNRNISYKIDTAKMIAYSEKEGSDFTKAEIDAYLSAGQQNNSGYTESDACFDFLSHRGSVAAAKQYHDDPPSFLWIKNIWYADVSYAHPIQGYDDFCKTITRNIVLKDGSVKKIGDVVSGGIYDSITAELTTEKEEANGYFILIVLSIAMIVLSQFVAMRSQKETNKYQSVDGSAARQQKIMMIIMPLIYIPFAFMYSAAFSVYMTMSSLISILTTLGANFFIGKSFDKKEEEEFKKKYTRTAPPKRGGGSKKK